METEESDELLTQEEINRLLYGSTFERMSEKHVLKAVFERLPYSLARRFKELYFQFTPEDLEQAIEHCFQFDDLLNLSDRTLQSLLLSAPPETLAAALHGCSSNLRDKVIKNVTKAKAESIRLTHDQTYDLPTVTAARDDLLRPIETKVHRLLAEQSLNNSD